MIYYKHSKQHTQKRGSKNESRKKEMIISTQIKLTSEGLAENKISMFRECAISLDVLNAGGYTEDYKQYKRVTHEIIGCILREFDSDKFITINNTLLWS